MAPRTWPLLYIKPTRAGSGRNLDLQRGLLAILSGQPVRGLFDDELDDLLLRGARVLLIDVPWFSTWLRRCAWRARPDA